MTLTNSPFSRVTTTAALRGTATQSPFAAVMGSEATSTVRDPGSR